MTWAKAVSLLCSPSEFKPMLGAGQVARPKCKLPEGATSRGAKLARMRESDRPVMVAVYTVLWVTCDMCITGARRKAKGYKVKPYELVYGRAATLVVYSI